MSEREIIQYVIVQSVNVQEILHESWQEKASRAHAHSLIYSYDVHAATESFDADLCVSSLEELCLEQIKHGSMTDSDE